MNKSKFYLPDFYFHFSLLKALVELYENNSAIFYDDVKIQAVYGAFPPSIWNGGRLTQGFISVDDAQDIVNFFNSKDVQCRYTYSNTLLEEKHLNDTFCNLMMEVANNGKNGIIIGSDILYNYLKEKYPSYQYVSSIVKCIDKKETLRLVDEDDRFDMLVLDCKYNKDLEFLSQIKNKDKVEIIVNHLCLDCCKDNDEHYRTVNESQLDFRKLSRVYCSYPDQSITMVKQREHYISRKDLVETYIPMGFSNFKIEGRGTHVVTVLEFCLEYLIKEEFHDFARNQVLRTLLR